MFSGIIRRNQTNMELKNVDNLKELARYITEINEPENIQNILNPQGFQYFYFVLDDKGKRIGYVELHYSINREDAFIKKIRLEQMYQEDVDLSEIVELVEEKARELGAIILSLSVPKDEDKLEKKGFVELNHTTTLQKKLV
jgi:ribosomal protein S8